MTAEQMCAQETHNDTEHQGPYQVRKVRPLLVNQDLLIGGGQPVKGVRMQVSLKVTWQHTSGVNNGGEPKPELQKYGEKLTHISEENIQHAQDQAQT